MTKSTLESNTRSVDLLTCTAEEGPKDTGSETLKLEVQDTFQHFLYNYYYN